MNNLIIRNIFRFIVLIVLQLIILNKVYMGGFINPMLYILFILMLPSRMGKIPMLLVAFVAGLSVDVSCNMLGFHACAATVTAMCRITFAERIITRNEDVSIDTPSIFTISPQYFIYYATLLTFIYTFLYYSLEIFSWSDLWRILLSSVLSTIVTVLLMLIWQVVFIRKKKR